MNNEEIKKEIKSIEQRVDSLTRDYEDITTQRALERLVNRFKYYAMPWVLAATAVIGILGYQSWSLRDSLKEADRAVLRAQEAVLGAQKAANGIVEERNKVIIKANDVRDEMDKQIKNFNTDVERTATKIKTEMDKKIEEFNTDVEKTATKIKTEMDKKIEEFNTDVSKAKEQVDEQVKSFKSNLEKKQLNLVAQISANAQTALNEVISDAQKASNEVIKNSKTSQGIKLLAKVPQDGFAYYGSLRDGEWSERFFERTSGDPFAKPSVGDVVEATGYVNARKGYIKLTLTGWENMPVKGVIQPKARLRVKDIKEIAWHYIWIEFTAEGRL